MKCLKAFINQIDYINKNMKTYHLKTVGLCIIVPLLLCACPQQNGSKGVVDDGLGKKTDKVETKNIKKGINDASNFAFSAQKEVDSAKKQIDEAKKHLKETENLLVEMRNNKSRYIEQVTSLKTILGSHFNSVEIHLTKTSDILKKQITALNKAETNLATTAERVIALENERDRLRTTIAHTQKELEEIKEFKEKYHKLQKYKWIVWGLGAWIVVKFLGGLGAWSPQGRVARALIG